MKKNEHKCLNKCTKVCGQQEEIEDDDDGEAMVVMFEERLK
jgi:hypothetical protein